MGVCVSRSPSFDPPAIKQGEELPSVVQIILGHPAEAKLVEVAEGDGWEGHVAGSHLVQLGDVRVAKVVLDPLIADEDQHGQGAQETQGPEDALD